MVRVTLVLLLLVACSDVRDFRGRWQGARVGDADVVRVGGPSDATATLDIDAIDKHGLSGHLAVDQIVADINFASLPGAEADVLAGMTFAGSPLRVYLAFIDTSDGGGSALAVIALYSDHRIELRLVRGNPQPLYGIFALGEAP